ncbi:MAG: hypothetical protein M1281_14660, partial [Chloroflexi bacterium]|nr:hypothetical protein [Chloroflexota bacterium]
MADKKKRYTTMIVLCAFAAVLLLAACQPPATPQAPGSLPTIPPTLAASTPQPSVAAGITLQGVRLEIVQAVLDGSFPVGCQGLAPGCTQAGEGRRYLAVTLNPIDLPTGDMLAYKEVPAEVGVKDDTGVFTSQTLRQYDPASHQLTLGFDVPAAASVFRLQWPGSADAAVLPAINLPKEAVTPTNGPDPLAPTATPEPTLDTAALLQRCQLAGYQTYLDEANNFCFAYSPRFELGVLDTGYPALFGPVYDRTANPLRLSLGIEVQAVPAGSTLAEWVEARQIEYGNPFVERSQITLGGEPAEQISWITSAPRLLDIYVLHRDRIVRLYYAPLVQDAPYQIEADLEGLYRTVASTFTFLDMPPAPAQNMPAREGVSTRCQVAGLETYSYPSDGYCFAYPGRFRVDASGSLLGPWLDPGMQPAQAILSVAVKEAPAGATLSQQVDDYLAQFASFQGTSPIQRIAAELDGEQAEMVEPIPGYGSSRQVLALHEGRLYQLSFSPADPGRGKYDMEALYRAVMDTFSYLPRSVSASPCALPEHGSYTDPVGGFCFSFPPHFTLSGIAEDQPDVIGPALDDNENPLRAGLKVKVDTVPAGSQIDALVRSFVEQFGAQEAQTIQRSPVTLAGLQGVRLDEVPEYGRSRILLVLHGDQLIQLVFTPSVKDFFKATYD